MARVALTLCASLAVCEAPGAAAGAPERLSLDDLSANRYEGGLIPNAAFVPGATAIAAREPFVGSLRVSEVRMRTSPAPLKSDRVFGKETALFPAVEISFLTVGADLVPASQDVLRAGSLNRGRSFWDLIVQPGRVWSEPGDGLWSRAAFPFALVNSLEGETHNGVAMFAYRGGRVSHLRFQIMQQTSPYYVSDDFTASGTAPATFRSGPPPELEKLTRDYAKSIAEEVPIRSWAELAARVGAERLAGFDETLSASDRVVAGLDYQGTFYLKSCVSAAGDLPWCDRARFGVWSATKALANATALLRLAQKFGPGVFDERIADYVVEARAYPAWRDVRFVDAINMATGVGNGSTRWNPNDVSDGYIDPTYDNWYSALSESGKVHALLETAHAYPWGPGKVARYRDQDMYLLGVAMDRYLKAKEGAAASIWTMLEREVYEPIGIRYAPTNRTIEADGARGQPLMAFGYYPTIGDMVRIARLYQNDGRHGDAQILYRPRVHELLHSRGPLGLPTGEKRRFGETFYYHAFWMNAFQAGDRCQILYPVMEGWGGNLIALFPQGSTAIRLAKARSDDDRSGDPADMAVVADRLAAFCP
jgi:Beta-lactamase